LVFVKINYNNPFQKDQKKFFSALISNMPLLMRGKQESV
jgi:hypothetical protein